jgi:peroxiredoxin
VLGVSVDSPYTQKAWAEKIGLNFPLLSDFPKREVAQRYGVYLPELGTANRATFLIDKEGVIRYKLVTAPKTARDHREALGVLKGI